MRWFFPSWNGDFRVEAVAGKPKCSSLVIVEPTAHEQEVLKKLAARFDENKWTKNLVAEMDASFRDNAKERRFELKAPVGDVAALMKQALRSQPAVLTAVTFKNGELLTSEGAGVDTERFVKEQSEKPDAKAGASVKRPTPSCPSCYVAAIGPATDTLLEFLTPEQHADWRDHRRMIVYGGITGHRYLLTHRHSALAGVFGKICADIDDGYIMKFHDWTVPPEEEVLAAKLILEHRESWLRNSATLLEPIPGWGEYSRITTSIQQAGTHMVLTNPFGGFTDGVPDAQFTEMFGCLLRAAVMQ